MDPDCRLYKKAPGDAAQLTYLGHVLMDHRHGLIAGEQVATADGIAEGRASTFRPRFSRKSGASHILSKSISAACSVIICAQHFPRTAAYVAIRIIGVRAVVRSLHHLPHHGWHALRYKTSDLSRGCVNHIDHPGEMKGLRHGHAIP